MRLSNLVHENPEIDLSPYLYEYGLTLAHFHKIQGVFPKVEERRFFQIRDAQFCKNHNMAEIYEFLIAHKPQKITEGFCHGDFHYANLLWEAGHLSAVLDFELAGWGNQEFDIARAIALRPGQRFLTTQAEMDHFMEGYNSVGAANRQSVLYYMIHIYSYFYFFKGNEPKYCEFIRRFMKKVTGCQIP